MGQCNDASDDHTTITIHSIHSAVQLRFRCAVPHNCHIIAIVVTLLSHTVQLQFSYAGVSNDDTQPGSYHTEAIIQPVSTIITAN